jgi:hypothetical protein
MIPGDIPVAQVHLDVREDIQRGQEPFARIMTAVKALAGDQALVLRVHEVEAALLLAVEIHPSPAPPPRHRRDLQAERERHECDR